MNVYVSLGIMPEEDGVRYNAFGAHCTFEQAMGDFAAAAEADSVTLSAELSPLCSDDCCYSVLATNEDGDTFEVGTIFKRPLDVTDQPIATLMTTEVMAAAQRIYQQVSEICDETTDEMPAEGPYGPEPLDEEEEGRQIMAFEDDAKLLASCFLKPKPEID